MKNPCFHLPWAKYFIFSPAIILKPDPFPGPVTRFF
jgi:hypothetical protein